MTVARFALLRFAFVLLALLPVSCKAEQELRSLKTEIIKIVSAGRDRGTFTVELALTPEAQQRGLMGRTELAPDKGMLFIFPGNTGARFWMKNTLIPLDMVFIDEDGRIVDIHAMAVPHDETFIGPHFPVRAVLEVAGGVAAKRRLNVGDLVLSDTLDRMVEESRIFEDDLPGEDDESAEKPAAASEKKQK